jgi:hypothetical protein
MQNILILIGGELSVLQIILIAFIGALIGETLRENENDTPMVLGHFIASWLASGFLGVLIGLLVQQFIFKDKPLAVASCSGYFGYIGNKQAGTFMQSLIQIFTKMGDQNKKDNDNKD